MPRLNPATGQPLPSLPTHTPEQALAVVVAAQAAYLGWRRTLMATREELLRRVASVLREEKAALSALITEEMGKLPKEADAEIDKCADTCDYLAAHGARDFEDISIGHPEFKQCLVAFEPLGVVLAVMPWNFPFWQAVRCAAPALLAGNALVLKHASNTLGCALALEKIFAKAGAPEGLFSVARVGADGVPALIAHPHVRGVALTGSTPAGRAVAAVAGQHLKKCVLELGGSDAYLVLEDAPLEQTARTLAAGRFINAGQSCIAAKRFVVVEKVLEPFTKALLEACREHGALAPLARADLRDTLHGQVQRSVGQGAQLLLGGVVPQGSGFYYPATVLGNVRAGMEAYSDELFGPVACICPARDEEDAVRIANDTAFGLGAGVFTADVERGLALARQLQAGLAFVNACVRSDPRLPFGGIKDSGYGRELSAFGLREFVNIKTLAVT